MDVVLHKACMFDRSFILLKLDMIKAFDCVGWAFLYVILERLGFGPYSLNMLRVANATATSVVLIQGKFSASFSLERSLRQGCPLSPVLYLLVANALNVMLTKIADCGDIKGVFIEEMGDQITHGQFAEDTNIIVAKRTYVDETFRIFNMLGLASGLYVKVVDVKAILISRDPLPQELADLPWKWETEGNP